MTNSYIEPDYTSGLRNAYNRQTQQLDQYYDAQRANDQRMVENARQQENLLKSLVQFSGTIKGLLDKKKEKDEKLKNTLLNANPDHELYLQDYRAMNAANGIPAYLENNADAIGFKNPNLTVEQRQQKIRNAVATKAVEDGFSKYHYGQYILPELNKNISSILKKSVKDSNDLKQLQIAELANNLFRDGLKNGRLADVYDEYIQKQSASKGRTLANVDGYNMLKNLASNGSMDVNQWEEFLATPKPHDGLPGGKGELRKRFSKVQIAEIDDLIQQSNKKRLDAKQLETDNRFRETNNQAIENVNQRFLDGEDSRALVRDLERVQGANKRDFGRTDDRLDKKIEALQKSDGSYLAQNAYFEELYSKGQLTAEMVQDTEDPKLMDQWLSRAQNQDKAREGEDYKSSKDSVTSLVKGVDTTFATTRGASGISPSANAVASLLKHKFETQFTKLVELEDPNAAVNAALSVQKYWTENGGGQTTLESDGIFALSPENTFPNYEKQLGNNASIAAQKILEFEKLNIKTKIDMSGGNAQRSLDTPNVFLNESEVNEAIQRINDGDGYSVKLKLVSGLYPTLGGPQEILDRQAAALDIETPERPASIETIYKQGNPFINCLINERGVDGLSTNQLLRQCRALDETYPLPTRN